MYEFKELPTKPAMADTPVQMPINILLAFPPSTARDEGTLKFNLVDALGRLLGQFGWEQARLDLSGQLDVGFRKAAPGQFARRAANFPARISGSSGGKVHAAANGSEGTIPVVDTMVGTPARMASSGAMPNDSAREGWTARS